MDFINVPVPPINQFQVKGVLKRVGGKELMKMVIPPRKWAIKGIIPAGVTLFSGDPKQGKSFFCLQMAVAIAGGLPLWPGRESEKQGDVLYMALEDDFGRLQERLGSLQDTMGLPDGALDSLQFVIQSETATDGGLQGIDHYLQFHSATTRMILIDTFQVFRDDDSGGNKAAYKSEYKELSHFKTLSRAHGVPIVLVHHFVKEKKGRDTVSAANGSAAMTGGVDTVIALTRSRGDFAANLEVTGREMRPLTVAMRSDKETALWTGDVSVEDAALTKERREIMEVLRKHNEPLEVQFIANSVGKLKNTVQALLARMLSEGIVSKPSRGLYAVPQEAVIKSGTLFS